MKIYLSYSCILCFKSFGQTKTHISITLQDIDMRWDTTQKKKPIVTRLSFLFLGLNNNDISFVVFMSNFQIQTLFSHYPHTHINKYIYIYITLRNKLNDFIKPYKDLSNFSLLVLGSPYSFFFCHLVNKTRHMNWDFGMR